MKNKILRTITLFILIVPTIICAQNDGSINNIGELQLRLNTLIKEIEKTHKNSQRVLEISQRYKQIAVKNKNALTSFTNQKGVCQNLEDTYKAEQQKVKLDQRVIRKQSKHILSCYETLEILIKSFEAASINFKNLSQSVATLKNMSKTEMATINSLEKQSEAIRSMIELEKENTKSFRIGIEKAIDEMED